MKTIYVSETKKTRVKDDLVGQVFGDLTALHRTGARSKHGSAMWLCACRCGTVTEVPRSYLKSGTKTSCGCTRKQHDFAANNRLHFVDGTCVEFIEKRQRRSDNKTGVAGVSVHGTRFRVNLTFQGKRHYYGTFDTLEEAVQVRRVAEKEFYEPFLKKYRRG